MLRIDFTLFVRFFDRQYYVATIPKSRFEFLDSFLIFNIVYSIVSLLRPAIQLTLVQTSIQALVYLKSN